MVLELEDSVHSVIFEAVGAGEQMDPLEAVAPEFNFADFSERDRFSLRVYVSALVASIEMYLGDTTRGTLSWMVVFKFIELFALWP